MQGRKENDLRYYSWEYLAEMCLQKDCRRLKLYSSAAPVPLKKIAHVRQISDSYALQRGGKLNASWHVTLVVCIARSVTFRNYQDMPQFSPTDKTAQDFRRKGVCF